MAGVRFCMAEAHGGRGFPPSYNNSLFTGVGVGVLFFKMVKQRNLARHYKILYYIYRDMGVVVHEI